MSHSTRVGLMGGFLATLCITIFYVSEPRLLFNGYSEIRLLILAGAVIYGLYSMRTNSLKVSSIAELTREKNNTKETDFVEFSVLLSTGFKIFLIGFLVTFFYIYVLVNYIDPSLEEVYRDTVVQMNIEYKDPKMAEELFQQQLKNIKEQSFFPTIGSLFSGSSIFRLLLGFLVSLITAAILRREKPSYQA